MNWSDAAQMILGDVAAPTKLSRVLKATDNDRIVDVALLSPLFVGLKPIELLLGDCELVALTRKNEVLADIDVEQLQLGDILTLAGSKTALAKVRETLTSL